MLQSFDTWVDQRTTVCYLHMTPCDKGTPECQVDVWGSGQFLSPPDIHLTSLHMTNFTRTLVYITINSNKVQMWQSHAESNIIQRVLNAVLCSKRYSAELLLRAGAHMHYVDEPRSSLGYSALNVVMRSKCAVE